MKYLSQKDARWSGKKIGSSYLTVGRMGCCLTSISMLSDLFGQWLPPDAIASHVDWFTPQGLVLWTKLNVAGMKFVWRQYGRNDAKILAALKDPKQGVILQVSHGTHWVVAVRKMWWKNDYVTVDPWTGRVGAAVGDYSNITGAAFFTKV